jgi:hypothetical protein
MNNKLEKIIDLLIEKTEEGKIKWKEDLGHDGATANAFIELSSIDSYVCCIYRCTMEDKEYFIQEEKFRIMSNGKDYPLSPEVDDYMLKVYHVIGPDEEDDFTIDNSGIYINSRQYPTLKDKLMKLNDLASAEVDTPSDMCSAIINVLTSM